MGIFTALPLAQMTLSISHVPQCPRFLLCKIEIVTRALFCEVVCNELMIRVFLLTAKTWANGMCVSAFVNSTVERAF